MRKSRFTEEQIILILKESEAGAATKDLLRRHGISHDTFYRWKRKYGGMEVSDARRLKQLEDENRRLERIGAGQVLNIEALKDFWERSCEGTRAALGSSVSCMQSARAISERRAVRWTGFPRATMRYRGTRPP